MTNLSRQVSMAEIKARQIIRDFRIESPDEIFLDEIACLKGVSVQEAVLRNYDGRLVRRGRKGIITVDSSIKEPGRRRFVVAHELGHFELEKEKERVFNCTTDDFMLWHYGQKALERNANLFAAELLLPASLFQPKCQTKEPSFDIIRSLADEFVTSLSATAIRFARYCSDRCAVVYSENRKIKWVAPSPEFGFFIEIGSELSRDTYANDFFENERIPDLPRAVPASAWIFDTVVSRFAQIKEHSIALNNYNGVLSLLWITEDITEDIEES